MESMTITKDQRQNSNDAHLKRTRKGVIEDMENVKNQGFQGIS